jgi:arsenate reductase
MLNILHNYNLTLKSEVIMDRELKVLFICIHNSGRSQMAEAFLKAMAGDRFQVESAGMEPRPINLLVIEAMKEEGIDISENTSDSVFEFFRQGKLFDYVITVCDESVEDKCPVFAGITKRLHWPFPDPAKLVGSHEEKMVELRTIRDAIKEKIEQWLHDFEA